MYDFTLAGGTELSGASLGSSSSSSWSGPSPVFSSNPSTLPVSPSLPAPSASSPPVSAPVPAPLPISSSSGSAPVQSVQPQSSSQSCSQPKVSHLIMSSILVKNVQIVSYRAKLSVHQDGISNMNFSFFFIGLYKQTATNSHQPSSSIICCQRWLPSYYQTSTSRHPTSRII